MATRIVLLADDLTGALDSATPFVARGLSVRVAIGSAGVRVAVPDAPDVLVVDTQSRDLSADAAAAHIAETWAALEPYAPRIVMKKVDSRLKGPVAAETAALMVASGRARAAVCPAVPDQARVVRAGHVHGHGVADPIDIAARFAGVPQVEIHDVATAEDLEAVARGLIAQDDVLMVGARGLAAALAAQIGTWRAHHAPPLAPPLGLPIVLAIGSRDPITAAQIDALATEGLLDGSAILVRAEADDTGEPPSSVAARLADGALALAEAIGARTILAVGGDTAGAILRALGADVLLPSHECAPGVPVATIAGHAGLTLATKSGGFGTPDTLATIIRAARADARQVAA